MRTFSLLYLEPFLIKCQSPVTKILYLSCKAGNLLVLVSWFLVLSDWIAGRRAANTIYIYIYKISTFKLVSSTVDFSCSVDVMCFSPRVPEN